MLSGILHDSGYSKEVGSLLAIWIFNDTTIIFNSTKIGIEILMNGQIIGRPGLKLKVYKGSLIAQVNQADKGQDPVNAPS